MILDIKYLRLAETALENVRGIPGHNGLNHTWQDFGNRGAALQQTWDRRCRDYGFIELFKIILEQSIIESWTH